MPHGLEGDANMAHSLGELAGALGLSVEGDQAIEIRGLAGLDYADAGELSFVTGPSYARAFAASRASAFLVPPDFDADDRPVIRSLAPYVDFGRAVLLIHPRRVIPPGVHATAVVADDAEVSPDASIGAYAVIGEGARIGARSCIHPHVTIYPNVTIGEDCVVHAGARLREGVVLGDRVLIQNGVVIGSDGFGFVLTTDGQRQRVPHTMGVHVGDDVEVGANSTIDASHAAQRKRSTGAVTTWIADRVKIDNLVQVGHGCGLGTGTILCAQVGLAGSTEVGRNVLFAGKSASAGHLEIGDGAMVGGMAGVHADVEPGRQMLGVPATDRRAWGRIVASWKRVPDLLRRVRRIEKEMGIRKD
jgi:UDP-3-O-[3-hydroxymyristoyl] glucosamine N-acyltransferase